MFVCKLHVVAAATSRGVNCLGRELIDFPPLPRRQHGAKT